MTDLRAAAQQALESLESLFNWQVDPERGKRCGDAVVALRAALAEPVQPAAWLIEYENDEREVRFVAGTRGVRQTPLYTAPPQRKPLTEEEIDSIWDSEKAFADIYAIARAIERAHGIV